MLNIKVYRANRTPLPIVDVSINISETFDVEDLSIRDHLLHEDAKNIANTLHTYLPSFTFDKLIQNLLDLKNKSLVEDLKLTVKDATNHCHPMGENQHRIIKCLDRLTVGEACSVAYIKAELSAKYLLIISPSDIKRSLRALDKRGALKFDGKIVVKV